MGGPRTGSPGLGRRDERLDGGSGREAPVGRGETDCVFSSETPGVVSASGRLHSMERAGRLGPAGVAHAQPSPNCRSLGRPLPVTARCTWRSELTAEVIVLDDPCE